MSIGSDDPAPGAARWTRWSLRRRVVLAAAAALVVLLGAGVATFAIALDRILLSSAQDAARSQLEQLVGVVSLDPQDPAGTLERASVEGSVVQLLDSHGSVLLSLGHDAADGPMTDRLDVPSGTVVQEQAGAIGPEQDPYALAVTGLVHGGDRQTLLVAVPLDVESMAVTRAVVTLASGALVLLVVLVVGIDRTVHRALRPVTRITAQVREISRALSPHRVSVPPTGDEIAELAVTMNAMLDRLARADAASRRFVADASHELRSPLATLRLQVETSTSGATTLDGPVVHGELLRLQRLVDDLLTLARADDEGLLALPREVDLDDVVEAEARRLAQVWPGALHVHLEPASVHGDAVRLGQALRNLVDNACRHTGGAIAILMQLDGDRVHVHVDNDGPPVPAEDRTRVFDRFVRLDEARVRDAGGSGLGLSIVEAIARAHAGTATTGQGPDGRCRFTMTLPLVPVAAAPPLTPSAAR
ncbi:sensor histidine kinase [Cellulomonas soli]|uniref:histidine kinase n=1 Tax=Cellulomonas soli TaxID=931535 RepID=A0A512PHF0_9CELL|nr:HAMP domain-containing sensor histidine kinase [Cellulomonas soli]NYI60778.1 signal transduction histidine kinase [Cellulomonas soli]GEP70638.1 two-component sensor histidine kinase [Cellulomonas soli]